MKKGILIVLLLGMLGWAIYEFAFTAEEAENEADGEEAFQIAEEDVTVTQDVGLEVGNHAPDFQLTTLQGEETSLSDYRGQKVMLNFWATWCPPCRAEMPDMEKFHQETDVEILAVNLTETEMSLNQVEQFTDELALTFPILLDENTTVATIYAIQPVPTSFMIDREGVIQFKTFGPLNYDQMVQVTSDMN